MSSHREAPAISEDQVADSTDVYAFVSPSAPDHVTLIANYIPFELPDGGPNFYQFGDDVLYAIHVDNNGDGNPDVSYEFRFATGYHVPSVFLYNTGPIQTLTDAHWNRRQTYSVTEVTYNAKGRATKKVLATDLACPPCNIGPLSTPNYPTLAQSAVHKLDNGITVFAGQRADGFYVDLGAVFDLGNTRPFQQDHETFGLTNTGIGQMAAGINSLQNSNVHAIAIDVPMTTIAEGGVRPTDATKQSSVIGVWTAAYRQKARVIEGNGKTSQSGPWTQVSRLGNPLFNELINPIDKKDHWNSQPPSKDKAFASYASNPLLAQLLPTLYPGVFPNLNAFVASSKPRGDILAIFLTGIPNGAIPGFQNYTPRKTPNVQAEMLRLNMAIPPSTGAGKSSNLGLIGGDLAGFPNGRRVFDDVATIELRALAGATLPLVDNSFTADKAAGAVSFGLTNGPSDITANNSTNYILEFPYLGVPHSGYLVDSTAPTAAQS